MQENLISIKKAANLLGISRHTAKRYIDIGILTAIDLKKSFVEKGGRSRPTWRVWKSSVDKILEQK